VQFYNNLSLGELNSSETECQLVTKKHVLWFHALLWADRLAALSVFDTQKITTCVTLLATEVHGGQFFPARFTKLQEP